MSSGVGGYAAQHPRWRSALGGIAAIADRIEDWRERRRMRQRLLAMNERELQDIGICRSDIEYELCRPFWRQ